MVIKMYELSKWRVPNMIGTSFYFARNICWVRWGNLCSL